MKILIINRWQDEFAQYHHYINHQKHKVAYISTTKGLKWLKPNSNVLIQNDLKNFKMLLKNTHKLVKDLGGLDLIIAMSESDLINAAKLREIFFLPGMNQFATDLVKNKVSMKKAIKKAHILAPAFFDCNENVALEKLISKKNFPIILKPKCEAGSRGLFKINNRQELEQIIKDIDLTEYECEEFINGDVFHIDGIIQDKKILFIKASKYIQNCLDFRYGKPVCSVMIDDKVLNQRIKTFTKKCLNALHLDSGIFHLEAINTKENELFFLEIGARMGGGESNVVIQDLYNINLAECWVKIQLSEKLSKFNKYSHLYGGLLLIPEPRIVPCKVISATSLIGKVPCLYKETLPAPGEIFDGHGAYDHVSGKFLFKGTNTKAIENAIKEVMEKFSIEVSIQENNIY